ncbi:MAG TPA: hypothetical protein QF468_07405 [Nitrospinota bacterium]|jgi:hypothetical protein|nr:hypothetical protein [Nitrospinota bacterium]|tara:strand:+ start:1749 stop:2264 length:516 start_codon:yes stop_codon:yes gene_type:complete
MSEEHKQVLLNEQEHISPEKRVDLILDQYKLYVEVADRISSRRQSANSFFLSINTALVALTSYLGMGNERYSGYWLIATAGIVLSYMWYRLVVSYKDLNTAKFKVVHEMESQLPLSPYDAEWEAVGRGKAPELYLPFTHVEIYVPWVFLVIHAVVLLQVTPFRVLLDMIVK